MTQIPIAPASLTVQNIQFQGPIDDRYVRLVAHNDPAQGGIRGEDGTPPEMLDASMLDGGKACFLDSPRDPYPAAHRCIYCGSQHYSSTSTRGLGEEHVIFEGIGGNLVLPSASCQSCERKTSAAETAVLSNLFYPVRKRLGIRGKKKRRPRKSRFSITSIVDGNDEEIRLPIDAHPTTLFMPKLNLPGLLTDRKKGTNGLGGLWIRHLCPTHQMGVRNFAGPALDTVKFCQVLAKTAHAFAVAEIGESAFFPYLSDFIRRQFEKSDRFLDCYHWVGGFLDSFAPSKALHELSMMPFYADGIWHLMVHVRLFGCLGTPVYTVMVGELTRQPNFVLAPDGRSVLGTSLVRRP